MQLLEESLQRPGRVDDVVQQRLRASAARDVADLLPHLEERAASVSERARTLLVQRGQAEEAQLRDTLEAQRRRVQEEITAYDRRAAQLSIDFDENERRQLEADRRAWGERLTQFHADLLREPQRVREFYDVQTTRVEPVGLVYLWPQSN
jgi:hypothetical protein